MGKTYYVRAGSGPPTDKQAFIDRAYLIVLLWECEGFFISLNRAHAEHLEARRIADLQQSPSFMSSQRAFIDFQNALAYAANVAKMLWPHVRSGELPAALKRTKRIRKMLKVRTRDANLRVLNKAANMRNHFEHIDVRLDLWSTHTKGSILMHALAEDMNSIAKSDRFNRYDYKRQILRMFEDKINIERLNRAVWNVWYAAVGANRLVEKRLGLTGLL